MTVTELPRTGDLVRRGNVYPKDPKPRVGRRILRRPVLRRGGNMEHPERRVLKRGDADIIKIPEKYFEGMDKGAVSTLLIAFL